ncbi:MAG TPA: hypothetical protein VFF39_04775 [Verrucomicrobiae bacterium]|nr:hypothetical protein [Verrucomicrobiae bacterium]
METKVREPLSNRFLAGAGFALIYALLPYAPVLAGLGVLALLPCLLYRLEERERRIALAPLTFASLMLTQKVFSAQITGLPRGYLVSQLPAPWLPLFFGICLYYMPDGMNWSRKITLGLATLILLAGLLPGSAFALVFGAMEYLLFVAVLAGLGMDYMQTSQAQRAPVRA